MIAYSGMILFEIRVVELEDSPTTPVFDFAVVMTGCGRWFSLD